VDTGRQKSRRRQEGRCDSDRSEDATDHEEDAVRQLGRKAKQAREAAAKLQKVIATLPEPSPALDQELQRLQAAAKAYAAARDQAKPPETRERELRNRFRTLHSKLEANVRRKSSLEADLADMESKVAKLKEALLKLDSICTEQDRKVRELHTALGAVQVDSESEDGEEDSESDMEAEDAGGAATSRRKGGWSTVGPKGKVTFPQAFTAAEQSAISLLRSGGPALRPLEKAEGDQDDRSRSPPGQRANGAP
jgi:chromosome segregation ATPase